MTPDRPDQPDHELYGEPSDEEIEEWIEEWDEADREAVEVLKGALSQYRLQPAPSSELASAAVTVRERMTDGDHPAAWVRQAAGLADEELPEDDAELLLRLAAATISPSEETGLEIDEEARLIALENADWLGAIVSAVRAGPGSDASPERLVEGVRDSPELEFEQELDSDDESFLETAFWTPVLAWEMLGLLDRDQRLTALGEWVLPRALARAWNGDFDAEPGSGS